MVGSVEGSGTTNEVQQYNFIDLVSTSSAFYRLKQVDFDGAFEYHKTISFTEDSGYIMIYPTFVKNSITIWGNQELEYNAILVDLSGKTHLTIPAQPVHRIEQILNTAIPRLDPTVYILRINDGFVTQSLKFIIK